MQFLTVNPLLGWWKPARALKKIDTLDSITANFYSPIIKKIYEIILKLRLNVLNVFIYFIHPISYKLKAC